MGLNMRKKSVAPNTFYVKYGKRWLDIGLASAALLLLSPLMLATAILVRIKLGSPVLFCQERPGKNEKIFKLYKFRSMINKRDKQGKQLSDEARLTNFGRWLRSTSLDELPELFNIIKGNMSIVGPRPLSVLYLPYYTEKERHRHDVLPGLTGLAQVKGRNAISWEKKFYYDVMYAKHISLKKDICIIFRTVKCVLEKKDIGQGEEAPESLHIERRERFEHKRKKGCAEGNPERG